jgi:hypothetical protein
LRCNLQRRKGQDERASWSGRTAGRRLAAAPYNKTTGWVRMPRTVLVSLPSLLVFFKKRRKELLILIPEWALGRCLLQIRSKEPSLHTEPRECRTRGKIAWVSHLGVRTKPCCGEGRGCRRGNFGSARNGSIRNLSPSFRAPG